MSSIYCLYDMPLMYECCYCNEPTPYEWFMATGYEWCYICDVELF